MRKSRVQLFFGILVGLVVVVVVAFAAQPKLLWQVGELMALMSLGGKAQNANSAVFTGSEEKTTFGSDSQQYVLTFTPPANAPKRNAVVVFIHGGGWNMGNPELYRFVGRFFANQGFATILLGYRLVPGHRFPVQLEDSQNGLKVGLEALAKRGIQGKQLIVGGHSAGAQLSSLMAYDPASTSSVSAQVDGLFLISGPLDFSLCQDGQISSLLNAYLANVPDREVANPISRINDRTPINVLAFHGGKDPVVDVKNSESFVAKINQTTPLAKLVVLPEAYHSDTLNMFFEDSPQRKTLLAWLGQVNQP